MKQRIHLGLAPLQILKEAEHEADFVEGQTDDVDQMGDLDDDLQAELAAAEHTRDFTVLVVRTAIDAVGDQNGSVPIQAPDRSRVRQMTFALAHAIRKHIFRAFGLGDLVGRGEATTPALPFVLALLSAACFLPLLFGPHGERLVKLGSCRASELLLEFRDALLRSLQLALLSQNQIDQSIGVDPTLTKVFLELLASIHSQSITDSQRFRECQLQRLDDYNGNAVDRFVEAKLFD